MLNAQTLIQKTEENLAWLAHTDLSHASASQLHNALSTAVMQMISPLWKAKEEERASGRSAFYLSAEYLTGRLVYNNLFCLGLLKDIRSLLSDKGVDLAVLEDVEDDAFGNGGLGRLAACFLDSAVTCNIPLTGYGLRYRYGLFKQSFVDHCQYEAPDDWAAFGDPWSVRRDDEAVIVSMKTGDVRAVPYDMPVIGFGGNNIGTLRLWQCESLNEIDFRAFNDQDYAKAASAKNRAEDITKFLYPNDTKNAGKQMRVKQQYVLTSASIQDILRKYRQRHGNDYSFLVAETAVQLNDTHPVMAIPELIRLLTDDGLSFEEAFLMSREIFAYTNHTVMQEALEKWYAPLLSSVCPRITEIIRLIDKRFKAEMAKVGQEILPNRCIIRDRMIHMAQLAVYATHATNGVAELHSGLLKTDLFADWYALYPERFQNKTNGITQRRWLGLCNPELCALLDDTVGEGYLTDLDQLKKLESKINKKLCARFAEIKKQKKVELADALFRQQGIRIDPDWVFDVQVKRLHEYKRQFMNALSILAIYDRLKSGKLKDFRPTVMIFGAKAAPGYVRAKSVIRFINLIAEKINNDPDVADLLKVVFVSNYNCSWAEKIIPAADISEQISPAGTEASGTGNMKFMLNGAVTLGTYDGANIEIVEEAGAENNYVFGARVEDIEKIKDTYDPKKIYRKNKLFAKCLDTLIDGTFPDPDGGFKELHDAILKGASWHKPDHYYVALDFEDYVDTKLRAIQDTGDTLAFARKCLMNISGAGKFSSDRTIRQYAAKIWNV